MLRRQDEEEASAHLVREREVLAVVDGKVDVVERMVGRAVDDGLERVASEHIRVVDEDRPGVDEDEDCEGRVVGERRRVSSSATHRAGREGRAAEDARAT